MRTELIVCLVIIGLLLIVVICLILVLVFKFRNNAKNIYKKNLNAVAEANIVALKNDIINTLQCIGYNELNFQTYSSVTCSNPEMRTKLVGKEARNKRCIENLTGVNLEFPEDSSIIKICSNNNIEKEKARLLLNTLISSDNTYVDEIKIKKYFLLIEQEFEKNLYEVGKKVCIETLKSPELDPGIYPYIGKMQYRLSYGQNNLEHLIECAISAYQLGPLFNLDAKLASLCGFFHDIGKAVDYDVCMHHVDAGLLIAKKFNLPEEVAYCIKFHHDREKNDDKYLALTKFVDKLSASKDGLRTKYNGDIKRKIQLLSIICKNNQFISKFKITDSVHTLILDVKDQVLASPKALNAFLDQLRFEIRVNEIFKNYYLEIKINNPNFNQMFKL